MGLSCLGCLTPCLGCEGGWFRVLGLFLGSVVGGEVVFLSHVFMGCMLCGWDEDGRICCCGLFLLYSFLFFKFGVGCLIIGVGNRVIDDYAGKNVDG